MIIIIVINVKSCSWSSDFGAYSFIVQQDSQITETTMRGEVYGDTKFQSKIGSLVSRVTKLATHGGYRKSENYRNQAG